MASFPFAFRPELHPLKQDICRRVFASAAESGLSLYLVGGYVRDAVIAGTAGDTGRTKPSQKLDFDFACTGGSAIAFAQKIAELMPGHFVLLDTVNDTARVVLDSGEWLDFAGCLGGSLEADVFRRDFTINALVFDPEKPDEIFDLTGGRADIENGVIRAVREDNLTDDPLRVLRAHRFAAKLGFKLDPATTRMLRAHAAGLEKMAAERVSHELFEIMETERAGSTLIDMGTSGVLETIFPEIKAMRRVTPNSFHHLGLYDHSLETVTQCQNQWDEIPDWCREDLQSDLQQGLSRFGATKLACLLHDIGKPDTWIIVDGDRHTFVGHDKLGARMAADIAARLKWSARVEKHICDMVRWHLRPGALYHQGPPTERAILRFYRAVGADVPALVVLARSDFRSTCGPGLAETRHLLENSLRELLDGYLVYVERSRKTPRLMDGGAVMQLLGIGPGPVVGQLLDDLAMAQGLNEVQDRGQAQEFIKRRWVEWYSTQPKGS